MKRPPTNHYWSLDQLHWQIHRQQHLLLPHPPTTTLTHGPTNWKTVRQQHQLPDQKKRRCSPLPHPFPCCPPPKTNPTEPHLLLNPISKILPHEQTPDPHCEAHYHCKMCTHCRIQPKKKNCPWPQWRPRPSPTISRLSKKKLKTHDCTICHKTGYDEVHCNWYCCKYCNLIGVEHLPIECPVFLAASVIPIPSTSIQPLRPTPPPSYSGNHTQYLNRIISSNIPHNAYDNGHFDNDYVKNDTYCDDWCSETEHNMDTWVWIQWLQM